MAKDINNPEAVDEWMAALDHPLKEVAEAARRSILAADANIGEQIKWNSPSFFYTGEMAAFDAKEYKRDLIVFHLRKKDRVLLVFPTGATIHDTTGLLEGNYTDGRRMVTFTGMEDFENKKAALQQVIRLWLEQIV
jgi:hypothetical protein